MLHPALKKMLAVGRVAAQVAGLHQPSEHIVQGLNV